MARRIIKDRRGLPKEIRDLVRRTNKMSVLAEFKYLKKRGIKPVTPLGVIRKMAKANSNVRTKITVTEKKYIGAGRGEAEFDPNTGKTAIRLHPALQFTTRKHIQSLIDHEKDHVKVYEDWKKYKR